jgi:dTDP-4-dehydrorhamnose 3,5-epimerase
VLILEPRVFGDERGFFMESWNARTFCEATGVEISFVQDNHSRSVRGVLRGIHYQVVKPQGKLIRAVAGSVLDVTVDLRRSSPTFRQWVAVQISAENRRQVWIPPGFGHGFLVQSEVAEIVYKATEYWHPEHDRCIRWNDAELGIDWRLGATTPLLSAKDAQAPSLRDGEIYP